MEGRGRVLGIPAVCTRMAGLKPSSPKLSRPSVQEY